MATLAKTIVIKHVSPDDVPEFKHKGGALDVPRYVFEIDGVEFPWYISVDGVHPEPVNRSGVPGITVAFLAERVEVTHALRGSE